MSFPSKEGRILNLLRELGAAGASFEKSHGRFNPKIHFYGGGSAVLSVKAEIAKRLNEDSEMTHMLVRGKSGVEILQNLIGLGYFNEGYGVLYLEEQVLRDLVGMKKEQEEMIKE